MIGREGELRLVESFLDAAAPGARGLVIEGEAGIGKTTIWQAALDAASLRGYRVVVTRPTEAEARIPFAGLNDLLGEVVDAWGSELPLPQQAALDVALMRASGSGEVAQPLALSLAVLELLRVGSAAQPLALGIDDAQWLDESSSTVLQFALRRLDAEPVIVIATERRAGSSVRPAVIGDLPTERVAHVAARALTAEEVDRLLESSFDLRLAPTALRRVQRLSSGNPFHALEIGRALAARGIDPTGGDVPVPDTVGELVRARLAALPDEAREVTTHVAALSHPTPALLEAALGRDVASPGLGAAREADVLAPDDDPVRFTHPLLSSEVYAALEDAERRDLHRRLASVVSEPEELARHLALAAAGPDPEVADALDAAASHALGRGAPDAAAELAELAATMTTETDPLRARRMAAAGRYRLMAGDAGRARELLEGALAEPAVQDGPARAELLFRLAGVRQLLDDFVASAELGEEALLHAHDDLALTVRIKLLLAGASFISGRQWAAGSRHAFEAMELAEESGDPALVAATIGPYASWRYATGAGYDPGLAARAAELEPFTVQLRTLDLPDFDLANIELQEGETAAGIARIGALLDRAERDGDYSSLPFLLANAALGDFLEGRSELARARIDQAARLARATDQRVAQVHTLASDARLSARLGDADRAIQAAADASALMAATSWRSGEWMMWADVARLELGRGDASAALVAVGGALDASGADESDRRRWALGTAAEALVMLGRHDDAGSVLADLDDQLRRHPSPRLAADALRARARLHASEGDVEAADAAVAEAETIHRHIGDPWELGRTLLVAGELHRRARRRAMARASLREALETFTFLGARSWAKQAREQLGRIGATRTDAGLTPTQRGVAELVATGLTNRQVADRLFMSVHTVEAHLSAIYDRLGLHSRRELAAALAGESEPIRDTPG
ncbi:MAG TPA: AAA family ATPase [Candidatus Limnocylindria bacterium]